MDEHPNAAWFREAVALIEHPEDRDIMRSTIAAPATRKPTSRITVGLGIGLVIVAALSVALAVGLGRGQGIAEGTGTIDRSHLGAGYPAHYGLAGPSQVGTTTAPMGIGPGYPPHYGLAGPSQLGTTAVRIGIGAGYPPHYGLAGPSQLDEGRRSACPVRCAGGDPGFAAVPAAELRRPDDHWHVVPLRTECQSRRATFSNLARGPTSGGLWLQRLVAHRGSLSCGSVNTTNMRCGNQHRPT